MIPDDIRTELARFLRSAAGDWLLHYWREHPASMPQHFTPADGNMQQHHIALHYAFGEGEKAKVNQLIGLAESKVVAEEPEPVRLIDTKSLV